MPATRSLLPTPKFRCQMFPPTFRARQKLFVAYWRFLRATTIFGPTHLALLTQKRKNARHPLIIAYTQKPSTLVSTNFSCPTKVVCSPPADFERHLAKFGTQLFGLTSFFRAEKMAATRSFTGSPPFSSHGTSLLDPPDNSCL